MGRDRLWVRRIPELVLRGHVTRASAPLLFFGAVWALDNGLRVAGGEPVTRISLALSLLELAGLLLVVSTILRLAEGYDEAAARVAAYDSLPELDPGRIGLLERLFRRIDAVWLWVVEEGTDWPETPAPTRIRRGLYACGLVLHATYLFPLGNLSTVLEIYGQVSGTFSFFLVIPFIYYPILAEFVAVVINVSAVLPSRIRRDRRLHFEDPHGYAGLREVGQLIETTGRRYAAGVVIYMLLTLGRASRMNALAGDGVVIYVDLLYVVAGTVGGLVLFCYPLVALHSLMSLCKERHLERIADRVGEIDGSGRFFPEVDAGELETKVTYMQEYINMNVVRDVHEYPVNGWQVTNVLTGFLIPYALEYALSVLL